MLDLEFLGLSMEGVAHSPVNQHVESEQHRAIVKCLQVFRAALNQTFAGWERLTRFR